ncbi:MAG: cation transporter [Verrucomicrobiaceae bacterium]|nr:cation transporter [Verrucomicrobiaceae bacterium]
MSVSKSSAKIAIYAALAGNFGVAITKFIAAVVTGSSVMLSEGVHSLVDTVNELLLLYGIARAKKAPDEDHPFGYGRELYFWSFIVALLVLALGAGVSAYEGISHIQNPEPMQRPLINYIVLAISIVFEGSSWWVSLRAFREGQGDQNFFDAFQRSKDPSTFTVLFEDSAALIGLFIALIGITASHLLHQPQWDGIASIGIAVVLALSSLLMAREIKELLIGEAASPAVRRDILTIAAADPAIRYANGVLTVHVAPQQIVAALSAEFEDALTTTDIERCINRLEHAIKVAHPSIFLLFIKPQTAETWRNRVASAQPGEAEQTAH